jgi:hypothetical protein
MERRGSRQLQHRLAAVGVVLAHALTGAMPWEGPRAGRDGRPSTVMVSYAYCQQDSVPDREDRYRLIGALLPGLRRHVRGPASCDVLNMDSIIRSMHEVEVNVTLEDEWQPVELYYVARGLRWAVWEVLDSWTHPGWPGKTYRKPIVEKWYRLRVFGPLPGQSHQLGEFVMIVTSYGNRDRWWIRPEMQNT